MKIHLLVWLFCWQLKSDGRLMRSGNHQNVPKFGRQFLSRYSLSELGEKVCTITEDVVALQQNCVNCMKNISSVLLTENGNKLYIGAKSLLLSADLEKCETIKTLNWMGGTDNMNCHPKWECGNYVTRIVNMGDSNLVACGTNYGNPDAIVLEPDLTLLMKIGNVPRICSQSPTWDSSYLQTSDQLFAGVNENQENSAITKFEVNENLQLSADRAVTTSDQWLSKAEFVASFESGDFAYFVMREETDQGHAAAIGRVCKSDPGYANDQSDIGKLFLTFTKTHITCKMSLSSQQTLDFRIIFAATFNSESKQIYATFTQYMDVDIGGFAVCGYSLSDIDAAFEGKYYTNDEIGNLISKDLYTPIDCVGYRNQHEAHLMYTTSTTVEQTTQFPIYYKLVQFTALLSDRVGSNTVLYIGTNSGTVEKIVVTQSNDLILATEFVVASSHIEVNSMQFADENNRMLVISTENTVSRFPVSRCSTHVELGQCITIRDPHCCWCQTSHSCSHIDDCSECVNDIKSGKVSAAFGRLTEYEWEKRGECIAMCEETDESCEKGERIIQFMQVYPKVVELRRVRENCTYEGTWKGFEPISDNVTESDRSANEARYSVLEDERLYKILALVFGSLFVVSLFIIVFLMIYKRRASPTKARKKSLIDRTNSTNIISDKPISYMTTPKKVDSGPPPQNGMIMQQDLDSLNNSLYLSQMTTEDERLLQVNIRDPSENMYSDVANTKTLPRNFGNHPTLDRRQQTLPNFNSMTMQRPPNSRYNYNSPQDPRFPPNQLP